MFNKVVLELIILTNPSSQYNRPLFHHKKNIVCCMLEIKNTYPTGVLATSWNFKAQFWNFVVLFLAQRNVFFYIKRS